MQRTCYGFGVSDADDMANRSKKLAKDLLEAMDKPDDPARQAYEAEKEIADKEALDDFYVRTGQKKKASAAGGAATRLAGRIAGASGTVDEQVSEHVALRFGALPSGGEQYVQVRVTTASGGSTSSQFLARGSATELAAKLGSADVAKEIEDTAAALVEQQRQQRLP